MMGGKKKSARIAAAGIDMKAAVSAKSAPPRDVPGQMMLFSPPPADERSPDQVRMAPIREIRRRRREARAQFLIPDPKGDDDGRQS